jgi:heme/copper-type cytochrome/quinol oxidase subunit 4
MARHLRRLPAWLVGLLIAVVVTLVAFLLFSALGFGDDPVVESLAIILG